MRILVLLSALILMMVGSQHAAAANIKIVVDKSTQTMEVTKDGALLYRWDVSTGSRDRWTPNGTFRVQWFSRHHRSSRYDWAPMPHSIFFNGNIAVHGTTAEGQLGRRASHGCVRLSRQNAATLFALVQKNTRGTRIIVRS
jgi:lipoprotein-anchoring transpeptidase ErfK/SrfK